MKSYTLNELIKKDPKVSFTCWADDMAGNCCVNCWKEVSLINWIDEFLGDVMECENKKHWNREDLEWVTDSCLLLNLKETNIAVCKRQMVKWCRERLEQVVKRNELEGK